MEAPQPGRAEPKLMHAPVSLQEPTSITLQTQDKLWNAQQLDSDDPFPIHIDGDTTLAVTPGGSISMKGTMILPSLRDTGRVSYHSLSLISPGGTIHLEATRGDLHLGDGSLIDVHGMTVRDAQPLYPGGPFGSSIHDGGRVTLTAPVGSLVFGNDLENDFGSVLVDMSGSQVVTDYVPNCDGGFWGIQRAGQAGSLDLTAAQDFDLSNLWVMQESELDSLPGGSLALTQPNRVLSFDQELIDFLKLNPGCDSLSLESRSGIDFSPASSIDFHFQGRLSLDAPEIVFHGQVGGSSIQLSASLLHILNSNDKFSLSTPLSQKASPAASYDEGQSGVITLASEGMMDIQGSVAFTHFSEVSLQAGQDIRLSDEQYTYKSGTGAQIQELWTGSIESAGPLLNLEAGRIYPTTRAHFSFLSGSKIETSRSLRRAPPGPMVSAGG